jgi:ATP adenylyltransferase
MERLWTPWRMGYIGGEKGSGCVFCDAIAANDDRAMLILHRGQHTFVIMNLYPYNTGHVMIVPYTHTADLPALSAEALAEMTALLPWVTALLRRTLRPGGFNIGLNLGEVAGAGIAAHLHMHVVPRWVGDANFMPVLARTAVLPELIPVTYAKLRGEMQRNPFPEIEDMPGLSEQGGGIPIDVDGRVALRRTSSGDWVLPKGHIEEGESVAVAAVREVVEEMGLATRILDWLGDLRFTYRKERHVGYFLLRVERRLPEFAAHDGVDTFFLAPEEALELLTFDRDRPIVREALARDAAIRAEETRSDA